MKTLTLKIIDTHDTFDADARLNMTQTLETLVKAFCEHVQQGEGAVVYFGKNVTTPEDLQDAGLEPETETYERTEDDN